MSNILELRALNVDYGRRDARNHVGHRVVSDFDLAVAPGETVALVGESGCGKSTTALAIMGLLANNATVSGKILLDGKDLLSLSPAARRDVSGRDVSMIFQEPMTSLNPVMTVGDQIAEVLHRHRRLSSRAARAHTISLLGRVKIPNPEQRVDDFPHRLSGGQRQRVMIAMAIACQPKVLIADEPTTALDVTIQAEILALLAELARNMQMALLLITHDLGVVAQYADRVAVMYGGRKLEEGRVDTLFGKDTEAMHPYTRGLRGASLTFDHAVHYRQERLAEIRVESTLSGKAPTFRFTLHKRDLRTPDNSAAMARAVSPSDKKVRAPMLRLTDLHTHYGQRGQLVKAVNGVSFDIAPGETVGLVGESGCGKSTLSRTVMKLIAPTAGDIELDGQRITHLGERAMRPLRRKVQMIFQDPFASLNPRHDVQGILDAALKAHHIRDRDERHARIVDVMRRVDLPLDALRRYPYEFSGGQRQRIGIARALVLQPALVICDEPVSALDVSVRAQVLNLLVELKQELGLSYLFIYHDLAVVRYIADRVLVMHGGQIVEEGDHQSLWDNPRHPYTQSLIAAVPRAA
ncbi:glutathione ABC transporter ATP-binding protein [Robbsia andropogonis]|uniref:Glutathione ABC transporter ATP-binding protein n=1 Tax=Robbsia andropogonis TaxID=28092 RepID=A0A0F5K287_9BURK|nr:ABC transporter ATP-binding protein [Robbsia andropogonis]KKB63652.1 glutathione ABC transporter ATP-binding protein [Robbsia andropogonis]